MKRKAAILLLLVFLWVCPAQAFFASAPVPDAPWKFRWEETIKLNCTPVQYLAMSSDGMWSLVDENGTVLKDAWLDGVDVYSFENYEFKNGMALMRVRGKWGAISDAGEIVIEPIYDYMGGFYEGLCRVEKDGMRGFIDESGKVIIPLEYFTAGDFYRGIAPVGKKTAGYEQPMSSEAGEGALWGVIDREGKVVMDFQYDSIEFMNDYDLMRVEIDDRFGLMDFSGNEVIPAVYDRLNISFFLSMDVMVAENGETTEYYQLTQGAAEKISYEQAAAEGVRPE